MNSNMDTLPSEIMECIADYLPPLDAVQLTRTSKKLCSQLSMGTTFPSQILSAFSRSNGNDYFHYGFEIPMMFQTSAHSVSVTMKWRDQGWGNRKGRFILVAEEREQSYDRYDSSSSSCDEDGRHFERFVFRSKVAKHSRRRLNIVFKPKQNETYHLWYKVGGGGGHVLHLSDVNVQALVIDPSKAAVKASNFLSKSNGLLPWDERFPTNNPLRQLRRDSLTTAVLASTSYLLEEGEPILPPLVSYFESHGIIESDLTVKFIKTIESALDSWSKQTCIYQDKWKNGNYYIYQGNNDSDEEGNEDDDDGDDDLSYLSHQENFDRNNYDFYQEEGNEYEDEDDGDDDDDLSHHDVFDDPYQHDTNGDRPRLFRRESIRRLFSFRSSRDGLPRPRFSFRFGNTLPLLFPE